ncbi:MAG: GAF domain-containing protein [Chloroflexota bacterium]
MRHFRDDFLTPPVEAETNLGSAPPALSGEPPGQRTTTAHTSAAGSADLPHQALIDLLPEAYAAVDVTTRRFALVNQATLRLLGYSQAALLAMSPADVIVTADGARLELAFQSLAPGTISRREWMLRASDGHTIPVSVSSVPIVLGDRVIIQMITHDLSEEAPAAAQRTLLALANDRLAVSLNYETTLTTLVALIVPGLADGCALDLIDRDGRRYRAVRASIDPTSADGLAVQIATADETRAATASSADLTPPLPVWPDEAVRGADDASFELHAHGRDLGVLSMRRLSPRAWTPEARTVAIALARRAAQAIDTALLWQTAERDLARRAAILRISRAFAESEPGGDHVMQVLLDEAMAMVGADHGGITLWDAPSSALVQVYSSNGRSNGVSVGLETSLSGRAALGRRPAISNDYQAEYGQGTPAGRFGSLAGVAAPMLHEGRLIGVLSVGTRLAGRRFGPDASEALELLAGMAASMLGTLERAQLQAVTLAARELAHRLNNDLALAVGTIDMLRDSPTVSPALRELIDDAAAGLDRVAEQLRRLHQLTRFQTRETPVGPALDLDRSTE